MPAGRLSLHKANHFSPARATGHTPLDRRTRPCPFRLTTRKNSRASRSDRDAPKSIPQSQAIAVCLEEDLQHQSQLSRIAREELTRLVEGGVRWFREAALETGEADRRDVVQVTTDVLRVVQNVRCRRSELDLEPLGDREPLQGSEVEVVCRVEL